MINIQNQNINSRCAHIGDLDFVYASLRDLAYEEKIGERFQLSKVNLKKFLFSEGKIADALIAEVESNSIGLVLFSKTNRNFTIFSKPGMYVHDMYILPEYRKRGVASFLAKSLRTIAMQNDYGRIDWVVLNDNDVGNEFFNNMPDAIRLDYIQSMRINL